MATTIRLSRTIENKLATIASEEQTTKSDLIKSALDQFLKRYDSSNSAYELGSESFGKYGSGRKDGSVNRKKLLKEKLRAKIAH